MRKKPTCTVGYGCGGSCINDKLICRSEVPKEFMERFVSAVKRAADGGRTNLPEAKGSAELESGDRLEITPGKAAIRNEFDEIVAESNNLDNLQADLASQIGDPEVVKGKDFPEQLANLGFTQQDGEWIKEGDNMRTVATVEGEEVYLQSNLYDSELFAESVWSAELSDSLKTIREDLDDKLRR